MKTDFEADLNRMDWFGAKTIIARILSIKPVNFVFRQMAAFFLSEKSSARFPVSVSSVRYRLKGGETVVLLDPVRDEVARSIYWGRGRCLEPSDQYALDCTEWLSEDARLFIDIGSYSGLFALVAARAQPELRAITFEIVPENQLLIVRNIIENDLVERVDARLCGLSDRSGFMKVAPSLHLDRLASSVTIGSDFSSGVRVPIERLDQAVGEVEGPVAMKIDVEGFEVGVLRGGSRLIKRHRPDFICEILPRSNDFKEIEATLSGLNYSFFQIDGDGLRKQEQIDPTKGGRDWLFTTRDTIPPELLSK